MSESNILLLGCGILRKEIKFLIEKSQWPLDTSFLDSALHIDFEKLAASLKSALARHSGRNILVFYGACHPLMEQIVEEAGAFRIPGQNCVEMLLGHDLFAEELEKGAFFLMEDWARRWDFIMARTFGENQEVVRDIFRGDRKYLSCLTTPCSGDYRVEAERAGRMVGLPLRWMHASLDNLESILQAAITRKEGERHA